MILSDKQIEDRIIFAPTTVSMRMFLLDYFKQIKSEKDIAENKIKKLLSNLYHRTEKLIILARKDIVEIAKDCGLKEEELSGKMH